MHPSASVILFTTASGAGYGLLFLLGVMLPLGLVPGDRWFGLAGMGIALGLITLGLLSSTFHLGHPERAWRAFSQWRSSWLSREGVAAVATYLPAAVLGIGWVFLERTGGAMAAAALLAALGAVATVVCTAMIYRSLKPIRSWHTGWTVAGYLLMSLATGAVLLTALLHLFAAPNPMADYVAAKALLLALLIKLFHWRHNDATASPATPASALGLPGARVSVLEWPHTEANYLLKEMGFAIARKHADKLRRSVIAAFALAALLALAAGLAGGAAATALACAAIGPTTLAVAIERWLFFAEARHTVMLYYGAQSA